MKPRKPIYLHPYVTCCVVLLVVISTPTTALSSSQYSSSQHSLPSSTRCDTPAESFSVWFLSQNCILHPFSYSKQAFLHIRRLMHFLFNYCKQRKKYFADSSVILNTSLTYENHTARYIYFCPPSMNNIAQCVFWSISRQFITAIRCVPSFIASTIPHIHQSSLGW